MISSSLVLTTFREWKLIELHVRTLSKGFASVDWVSKSGIWSSVRAGVGCDADAGEEGCCCWGSSGDLGLGRGDGLGGGRMAKMVD